MPRNDENLAGQITDWRARAYGLAVTALGIVFAGASTTIKSAWLQNTALALATTLVSTGALSLLFELALRRSVYRELLRLVGISKSLSSQQIISAGKYSSIDWSQVFNAKSSLNFLLIDPSSWVDQHLNSLFDSGRQRRVDIRFIFTDPQATYFREVAESCGFGHKAYEYSVIQAAEKVERVWLDLKSRGLLFSKSTLEIRFLNVRPLYSLATCDDATVIMLTSVTGRVGADVDYFYEHNGDRGIYPANWHREQLSRLEQLPIRFSNEVS